MQFRIKSAALTLCAGFLSGTVLSSASAQTDWIGEPFAADLRIHGGASEANGQINIDHDHVRFEFSQPDGTTGISIVDMKAKKSYVILPEQRAYMVSDPNRTPGALQTLWTRMNQSGAASPCGGYQRAERLGSEEVGGRTAEKWRCTEPNAPQYMRNTTVWIDRRIQFLLRMESDDGGGMELINVREGPQPRELFEVPSGYSKMDMPVLPRGNDGGVAGGGGAMGRGAGAPGSAPGAPPAGMNMEEIMRQAEEGMTPEQRKQFREMMQRMQPPSQ